MGMTFAVHEGYRATYQKYYPRKDPAMIEDFSWLECRDLVKDIAQDLVDIIDQLSPDQSYRIYKIRYPYGASIIDKQGIFNLPTYDKYTVPINSKEVPALMRENLGYNQFSVPVSLILAGKTQMFTDISDNSIETCALYSIGDLLLFTHDFDEKSSYFARRFWQMTSGVRTPILLPGISDSILFERLRRHFNLDLIKPQSQKDHWKLFVELANHRLFPEKWYTELLVFSARWFENSEDPNWKAFRLTLLERAWRKCEYSRNIASINQLWKLFFSSLRNKKACNFVLGMVKQIIEASIGQNVSYFASDGECASGPFNTLVEIFLDIYGLNKHAPILMLPDIYHFNHDRSHYIPIQLPAKSAGQIKGHSYGNLISDTREIKCVLQQFVKKVTSGEIPVEDTIFAELPNLEYLFYHSDRDKFGELLSSKYSMDDEPVMKKWLKHPRNRKLAYRSDFMRSFVKLKRASQFESKYKV